MSVAQIRAARRRRNLIRRVNGPKPVNAMTSKRRLELKVSGERARQARSKGKGK